MSRGLSRFTPIPPGATSLPRGAAKTPRTFTGTIAPAGPLPTAAELEAAVIAAIEGTSGAPTPAAGDRCLLRLPGTGPARMEYEFFATGGGGFEQNEFFFHFTASGATLWARGWQMGLW